MSATLIAAIVAAVETLAQIVPSLVNSVNLLKSGNATQADVDAAVKAMDDAIATWDARKPPSGGAS